MTTDDYITTTGERWVAGDSFGLCVADTDNLMPNAITSTRLLAELRALRAQRDELLALVRHAAEDSCVTTSDDAGCFYCDWSEHRDDCPAKPFLTDPRTKVQP